MALEAIASVFDLLFRGTLESDRTEPVRRLWTFEQHEVNGEQRSVRAT
jgi:hypothetical protein